MEKVTGIGGFFFRASDPDRLARRYQEHLAVDPIPSGEDQEAWQQQAGPTEFAPFAQNAIVAQLEAAGIAVAVDAEKYPQGRFGRLNDPDGNRIKLWEPAPL